MKTRKINTRFMVGNIDVEGVISDIISNEYGCGVVYSSGFSFDDAIYSDGFISAIEKGLIPNIEMIEPSHTVRKSQEYHHMIIDDVCYNVYFK